MSLRLVWATYIVGFSQSGIQSETWPQKHQQQQNQKKNDNKIKLKLYSKSWSKKEHEEKYLRLTVFILTSHL